MGKIILDFNSLSLSSLPPPNSLQLTGLRAIPGLDQTKKYIPTRVRPCLPYNAVISLSCHRTLSLGWFVVYLPLRCSPYHWRSAVSISLSGFYFIVLHISFQVDIIHPILNIFNNIRRVLPKNLILIRYFLEQTCLKPRRTKKDTIECEGESSVNVKYL
jgi:hypothetical protein